MKLGTIWDAWKKAEWVVELDRENWITESEYITAADYLEHEDIRENVDNFRSRYIRRERQRLKFVDHIIDHIAWYDENKEKIVIWEGE